MSDRDFLNWLADRLVLVYGEPAGVDFVLKLRAIARAIPPRQATPNMSHDRDAVTKPPRKRPL